MHQVGTGSEVMITVRHMFTFGAGQTTGRLEGLSVLSVHLPYSMTRRHIHILKSSLWSCQDTQLYVVLHTLDKIKPLLSWCW